MKTETIQYNQFLHDKDIRCKDCVRCSGQIPDHRICYDFEPRSGIKTRIDELREQFDQDINYQKNLRRDHGLP